MTHRCGFTLVERPQRQGKNTQFLWLINMTFAERTREGGGLTNLKIVGKLNRERVPFLYLIFEIATEAVEAVPLHIGLSNSV